MIYPIAETFHSLQGEGTYTGTPMKFIRLAGCNVGKKETPPIESQLGQLAHFNPTHTICTSFDGTRFLCDTDYNKNESTSAKSLLADAWEEHVCITGGEPFLHDLRELLDAADVKNIQVHVETSGTIQIPHWARVRSKVTPWITCSPKKGYLTENNLLVDEFKFVINSNVKASDITHWLKDHQIDPATITCYLQPVNPVHEVDHLQMQYVIGLLKELPGFRLSAQNHKLWRLR